MPRNNRIAKVFTCEQCELKYRRRDGMKPSRKFCSQRCYFASRQRDFLPRFWDSVNKTDACWLWFGAISEQSGYGTITVRLPDDPQSKARSVHTLSWIIHNGPIPQGLNVCHRCDVRNCVRPDHLFLGTNTDNMQDMAQKGRSMYGARNVNAKVTDDIVRQIRQRYSTKKRGDVKRMQQEFGIDRTAIHQIVTRRTWRRVSD